MHQGVPRLKRHVKASHASATPATDGRSIVALLGSEGLFCFDMNGTLKWRQDLGLMDVGLVDDPSYQWGPASSPIIFEDLVIVQNDRHKDSFVAAYDLATGKEVWRTTHDEYPSWATPTIARGPSGGRRSSPTAGKYIRGLDPKTGRELWRLSDNHHPGEGADAHRRRRPGHRDRRLSRRRPADLRDPARRLGRRSGRRRSRGGPIAASPYTGTPLLYDGILYVCTDNGILSAYDREDRRAASTSSASGQARRVQRLAGRRRRPHLPGERGRRRLRRQGGSGVRAARDQPHGRDADGHAGDLRQHAHRPDADRSSWASDS